MSYAIHYRASVKRDLRRLDAKSLRRIDAVILALADDPRLRGCVKLAGASDLWRIRIGDYRVVYEIRDDSLIVLIIAVAHRREVYRGL